MYEIPIAFIPKSFTDVFEKQLFSIFDNLTIISLILDLMLKLKDFQCTYLFQ